MSKFWEAIKNAASATANFIIENKAGIASGLIIISKVIPNPTISTVAEVIAALLTGGELVKPAQKVSATSKLDKLPMNGRKTAIGNTILLVSIFEHHWIFIGLVVIGLLIVIVGFIHKFVKKKPESKLAVKLQVKK